MITRPTTLLTICAREMCPCPQCAAAVHVTGRPVGGWGGRARAAGTPRPSVATPHWAWAQTTGRPGLTGRGPTRAGVWDGGRLIDRIENRAALSRR